MNDPPRRSLPGQSLQIEKGFWASLGAWIWEWFFVWHFRQDVLVFKLKAGIVALLFFYLLVQVFTRWP